MECAANLCESRERPAAERCLSKTILSCAFLCRASTFLLFSFTDIHTLAHTHSLTLTLPVAVGNAAENVSLVLIFALRVPDISRRICYHPIANDVQVSVTFLTFLALRRSLSISVISSGSSRNATTRALIIATTTASLIAANTRRAQRAAKIDRRRQQSR